MRAAPQQAPAPTNITAEQFACDVCGKMAVIVLGERSPESKAGWTVWNLSMPAYPRCAQHCGTSASRIAKAAGAK